MAAFGSLGKAMSEASSWVAVYSAPDVGIVGATVGVYLANLHAGTSVVKIAIGSTFPPNPVDILDSPKTLNEGDDFERSPLPISPGESVYVYADNSDIACNVRGIEAVSVTS